MDYVPIRCAIRTHKIYRTRLNLNPDRSETTASLRSHGAGLRYRDMTGLMVEATIAESQRFISSTDPKSDPRMLFSVMKPF